MFDVNKLHIKNDSIYMGNVPIIEKFPISHWNSPEVFERAGIDGYEPMTAKEIETDEEKNEKFNDNNYLIEEKFDGTRALVYFLKENENGFARVFSRRISKKTDFYVENTDSLPHIREIDLVSMNGTILDGEMFIEDKPFKEVASVLNSLPNRAIKRQLEVGFVTFHAFDILFYKDIDLRNMDLEKRKKYLKLAVEEIDNPYIKLVNSFECGETLKDFYGGKYVDEKVKNKVEYLNFLEENKDTYPEIYKCFEKKSITPKAFYELIVSTGGEGVIIKDKKGKYRHKRGKEYLKIKKFLTRDLIVIGFNEPTREYTGKEIKKWEYWVNEEDKRLLIGNYYSNKKYTPVTKHYYNNQVGNLLLGVIISKEEYVNIPQNKRGDVLAPSLFNLNSTLDKTHYIMCVCECAGFDDELREYFTKHREEMEGRVVEVLANEIFKDSGKLRHPRFLRMREDKNIEMCSWSSHILS